MAWIGVKTIMNPEKKGIKLNQPSAVKIKTIKVFICGIIVSKIILSQTIWNCYIHKQKGRYWQLHLI